MDTHMFRVLHPQVRAQFSSHLIGFIIFLSFLYIGVSDLACWLLWLLWKKLLPPPQICSVYYPVTSLGLNLSDTESIRDLNLAVVKHMSLQLGGFK
jgi:hypothetical protein